MTLRSAAEGQEVNSHKADEVSADHRPIRPWRRPGQTLNVERTFSSSNPMMPKSEKPDRKHKLLERGRRCWAPDEGYG